MYMRMIFFVIKRCEMFVMTHALDVEILPKRR